MYMYLCPASRPIAQLPQTRGEHGPAGAEANRSGCYSRSSRHDEGLGSVSATPQGTGSGPKCKYWYQSALGALSNDNRPIAE